MAGSKKDITKAAAESPKSTTRTRKHYSTKKKSKKEGIPSSSIKEDEDPGYPATATTMTKLYIRSESRIPT
eukprot:scaffold145245_cov83-Attheya_sp.AAC.1